MSRRTIDQTTAEMLPNGRPSFELVVGWDPPTSSFYMQLWNTKKDEVFWQRGILGEFPTFDDLMIELKELADEGLIHWPVDPVVLEVLLDDKARNLNTNNQDWDEVEKRKGLFA